MNVVKLFGHHIDLDPVVMISDLIPPANFKESDDVATVNGCLVWDGAKFSSIKVCRVAFQLRDGVALLTAPWPQYEEFVKKGTVEKDWRAEFETACNDTLTQIRRDYEDLVRLWKETRK